MSDQRHVGVVEIFAMGTVSQTGFSRYATMFLVSCAVLFFEILIIRILSVLFWYHFVFLSVSLALLGLGVPGVWFAVRGVGPAALGRALWISALAIPGSLVAVFQFHRYFEQPIALDVLVLLVPFLSLGSAVCILLVEAPGREVGRVYAADLMGATLAALLVVPLMYWFPTPLLLATMGLLPLGALVLLDRRCWRWSLPIGLAILSLVLWETPLEPHRQSKDLSDEPLYSVWGPTALITIYPSERYGEGWGFGSNYDYRMHPVEQLYLELDGHAGTFVTRLNRPVDQLDHLFFDVTSVGHQLQGPRRVCIIGGGGGRDILTALKAGAEEVAAVEINRKIIDTLSGPFREYSGDVYHLTGVEAVAGEGRSYLTHSGGDYDLIQISLIDTWAATAAGAMALSENYLYTVEAFQLYFRKLAPQGILSTSRWNHPTIGFPAESVRLVLMVQQALELEGIQEPSKHLAFVQGGRVGTLLVSKSPFSETQLEQLTRTSIRYGFQLLWPIQSWPSGYSQRTDWVPQALLAGPDWFSQQGFNVDPVTDDRPFFFDTMGQQLQGSVRTALVVILGLALILFFLPFVIKREITRQPDFLKGSFFFVAIGLGFMLIELPWIQRFILYLGHPSYSTTVILASLLLGAGIGSWTAARVSVDRVARVALLLPAVLVLINLFTPALFGATLGWHFGWRLGLTFLVVTPAGFLMGFPFPVGMTIFHRSNRAWFWAVNGASSVLGSVCALVLSMTLGFSSVLMLGAISYLAAVWIFRRHTLPSYAAGS